VNVRHRALARQTHLVWNPVTQRLDPLACEQCGASIRSVYPLADGQALRFVCLRCQQTAATAPRRLKTAGSTKAG